MNRRCAYCFAPETRANPLVMSTDYIGGVGYVTTGPECWDTIACWGRMDERTTPQPLRPEDGPALALAVERWLQEGASHAG